EALPRALALDREHDLLEAADVRRRDVEVLDLPATRLHVAAVDVVEVAREERRLVASGSRADLDDHLAAQVLRLRDQRLLDLAVEHRLLRLEGGEILARE